MKMKISYWLVLMFITLNGVTVMLRNLGLTGVPLMALDVGQWEDAVDADDVVESWEWEEREFFDVGAGLGYIWNLNLPLIESFQATLQYYGCPSELLDPIKLLWRSIMIGFVISFFSGRDFMP